jgi:FlaA1/EpsC-like NDP-sugar epimerase
MEIEKILGRKEWSNLLDITADGLSILITGASGSIGKRLCERLLGCDVVATDVVECVNKLDVTDILSIKPYTNKKFDVVINLAGAKHAPKGEQDSFEALNINTIGTANLIKLFPSAKVILTSTCKSCNPETVYGASKLIAERLTLNSGNSVARFYNVVQSSGNVFEIWEQQKTKEVASNCKRFFVSLDEAVGLIIYTMLAPQGRYSVNPMELREMRDIYTACYGKEPYKLITPRRGDRLVELKHSTSEYVEIENEGSILKVKSYHDDTRAI